MLILFAASRQSHAKSVDSRYLGWTEGYREGRWQKQREELEHQALGTSCCIRAGERTSRNTDLGLERWLGGYEHSLQIYITGSLHWPMRIQWAPTVYSVLLLMAGRIIPGGHSPKFISTGQEMSSYVLLRKPRGYSVSLQ